MKLIGNIFSDRRQPTRACERRKNISLIDCIKENLKSISDLNYVVFYDKPFLKFERILETYLAYAHIGFRSFLKSMS